uniref:AB hydrolase-1 domain-containing protein n=1 Tax=Leersia perrieri TaxID=77586 RepID=A0A0D9WFS7_9ORYZ
MTPPKSTGVVRGAEVDTAGRQKQQHHFVVVHGLCHGAWCWYKAATALRHAGHRVTALDMAAAGASPARVDEVRTFEEYSRPLLDALAALPPGERVVLVGHSQGGFSVALATELFLERLAAVVFLTASMPPVGRPMAATTEEDLTLALSLIRPANRFTGDALMRNASFLTNERYGSARRVFVIVKDDRAIPVEFQRRMVAQSPGVEVVDLAGADHMAMISKPAKLADLLVRIADKAGQL